MIWKLSLFNKRNDGLSNVIVYKISNFKSDSLHKQSFTFYSGVSREERFKKSKLEGTKFGIFSYFLIA